MLVVFHSQSAFAGKVSGKMPMCLCRGPPEEVTLCPSQWLCIEMIAYSFAQGGGGGGMFGKMLFSDLLRWSMYHGDTNERQRSELHMVRKEGGKGKWH